MKAANSNEGLDQMAKSGNPTFRAYPLFTLLLGITGDATNSWNVYVTGTGGSSLPPKCTLRVVLLRLSPLAPGESHYRASVDEVEQEDGSVQEG